MNELFSSQCIVEFVWKFHVFDSQLADGFEVGVFGGLHEHESS